MVLRQTRLYIFFSSYKRFVSVDERFPGCGILSPSSAAISNLKSAFRNPIRLALSATRAVATMRLAGLGPLNSLCHARVVGVIFGEPITRPRGNQFLAPAACTAFSPAPLDPAKGSHNPGPRLPPYSCGLSQNSSPRHCGGGVVLISDRRFQKADWKKRIVRFPNLQSVICLRKRLWTIHPRNANGC